MCTDQALDVLDVEVGLQRRDAGGRDVGDLAARRALDLVAELTHVLAQAVLAERVVARQELQHQTTAVSAGTLIVPRPV